LQIIKHRINTVSDLMDLDTQYGAELDLRSDGQDIIIHHDPFAKGALFKEWLSHYHHGTLILNVKEEGLETSVLALLKHYKIEDFFFLDQSFPFLLKTAKTKESRCAVRWSEYESFDTVLAVGTLIDWVWVDCFSTFPIKESHVKPLYLLIFKPLTFIGHLLGGANGASIGLGLTVLILDVLLLAAIRSLMPKIKKYWAVYLYWLLPITIYVNYWHGQLDVLPMLLLFTSFIMLSKHRHLWSGIALGAAISAKFVMAVALPFFVIFLFQDRRLRADLFKFMGGAALANLVTIPFALTDGFKQMVFQTPESEKLFELKYSYGEGLELYFVPAALILMAYLAWRLRRYIAGDSGAGKDTLSDSLVGLLGPEITVTVSGDDYHSYDRKKPIWRAVTHLDPLANDLHKYESDILALMTRSSIKARHYDHITGKMTKPGIFGARDFIISSGLHALYLPNLVNRSKLSVFLDMDEGLRRALKMRRDVDIRGHSQKAVEAALAKREPDSEKFIRPQKSKADLILRLFKSQNEIALETIFSPGINTAKIEKLLVSLGDHDVRPGMLPDNRISLIVYGSASAETISKLAHTIAPNMLKMMRRTPLWRDGAIGLSQLFVMFELEQKLFNGTT